MTDDPNWESIGRDLVVETLEDHVDVVAEAVRSLAATVEDGEDPTQTDIDAVRVALMDLLATIEETITPLVPGAQPYEKAADFIPASRLREVLDELEDS